LLYFIERAAPKRMSHSLFFLLSRLQIAPSFPFFHDGEIQVFFSPGGRRSTGCSSPSSSSGSFCLGPNCSLSSEAGIFLRFIVDRPLYKIFSLFFQDGRRLLFPFLKMTTNSPSSTCEIFGPQCSFDHSLFRQG